MQYTSGSYIEPFSNLAGPLIGIQKEISPILEAFPERKPRLRLKYNDITIEYMLAPLILSLQYLAKRAKKLQNGRLNMYVLYIGITILVLLAWVIVSN